MDAQTTRDREPTSFAPSLHPEPKPARGPEHQRMAMFAGRWRAEGRTRTPDGRTCHMISRERWEWLPGGFFLTMQFDSQAGEFRHCGSGHIGYDPRKGGHFVRMIDNYGYDREYRASGSEGRWRLTGERERAIYDFSEDGRSLEIAWDYRPEGGDWQELCRLKAVRTAGMPSGN